MTRAFGLNRDDGRHARSLFCRASLHSQHPSGRADLSAHLPAKVLDQNSVGSCVACTFAAGIVTALSVRGTPLPWIPSVAALYTTCLALDRLDASTMIVDAGTQLLTAAEAVSEWGVVEMGKPVSVGGYVRECDCGPDQVRGPDFLQLKRQAHRLVLGAHVISSLDDCRLSLDNGYPVATGGWVSSEFCDYLATSAPIGQQDPDDPDGGGHAVLVYGYEDLPGGETAWFGLNSWGTSYGKAGRFIAGNRFMQQRWELYSLAVR